MGNVAGVGYNPSHMFGKLKQAAIRKMVQSQMKDVPADQQQMIMELVEKKPELFQQMAKEMQAELKANGNNQMAAAMKVLPKYQQEIAAVMSPEMKQKMMQMAGAQRTGGFNPNGTIRK
jgi:head-tail adaptor